MTEIIHMKYINMNKIYLCNINHFNIYLYSRLLELLT